MGDDYYPARKKAVSSTGINACGEEGSGISALVDVRNHASLKQEFNIEQVYGQL
jgi:hypothetical protein